MKKDGYKYYSLLLVFCLFAHFALPTHALTNRPVYSVKKSDDSYAQLAIAPLSETVGNVNFTKWKGIEGDQPKISIDEGPFNGYVYSVNDLYKLSSKARHFCLLNDALPDNIFFYTPCSLRAPPVC